MALRKYDRHGKGYAGACGLFLCVVIFCAVMVLFAADQSQGQGLVLTGEVSSTEDNGISSELRSYPLNIETITLTRSESGIKEELPLEDYVAGVVAGEMPVTFGSEALKAQAVIARTYGIAVITQGGELCDDPGHCQCYYDPDTLKENWGSEFESKYALCQEAAAATEGELLLYGDEIAKTFFHSTCGGRTSSAAEVWGEDIPYLQSVNCEWDKDAPRYSATVTLAVTELPYLLNIDGGGDVPAAAGFTGSGRVSEVTYGGETIKATDFRKSLSLNSTDFSIDSQGDQVVITTKGFGHGVGLCQYGANGMSKAGYDYKEILEHYYTGVSLGKITKSLR